MSEISIGWTGLALGLVLAVLIVWAGRFSTTSTLMSITIVTWLIVAVIVAAVLTFDGVQP